MKGNDAALALPAKDDVAAALPRPLEPEAF
jgi:hypothetical protein